MVNYIIKRIVMMIPVLVGVSFLVFSLLHFAPGDPARIMLGDDAPVEAIEEMREEPVSYTHLDVYKRQV